MTSRVKGYVAAVAAVALVAGAFSFAPVRSFASELLNVFRINKVETINVTMDDLTKLRTAMSGTGKVDIESFGEIAMSGNPEVRLVTIDQARSALDFPIKLPADLGQPTLRLQTATTMSVKPTVQKVNSLLKSLGGTKMLPAEIDGKEFTFTMPAILTAEYASTSGKSVIVSEARGPVIDAPVGTDVNAIRDALLDLPVVPDNIRNQLQAVNDWQHTMLVPSFEGSAKKVTVNGNDGVFITQPSNFKGAEGPVDPDQAPDGRDGQLRQPENFNMTDLVWQKDGVVYVIIGDLTLDKALAIAASMK